MIVDTSKSRRARLRPVPVGDVVLADDFWAPRRKINLESTLPSQYRQCEESGRLRNFQRAAGKADEPFAGWFFNDSDVYKWLEAAATSLIDQPSEDLGRVVDAAVDLIAGAQRPDGYVNTYFSRERSDQRWTNPDLHELYCAGHLFQAAVVHWRVTGSERLLDVGRRFADYLHDTFLVSENRRDWVDGHEEVKLGLVELFRATGKPRYLDLARHFLEVRGHGFMNREAERGAAYFQDDKPFRELERLQGHCVRAVYYACGVTDILLETGDESPHGPLTRLWDHMTARQMYISGGLGSRWSGEAFGKDWELPNERAYTETCAAIGSVMWNWRTLALDGQGRYADLMEWTLYNAVLPGISLDGQRYFYQNPLADDGSHRRQEWFGCACCPPNVARLLAQLPTYFYSVSDDRGIWVHLYASGEARLNVPCVGFVTVRQETGYPWDGNIRLAVSSGGGDFVLRLRVPAWCGPDAKLEINGKPGNIDLVPGTYAVIDRCWQPNDVINLHLPMPVRRIAAHPYALENTGRVALARGPILYCLETADHPGMDLRDLGLDTQTPVRATDHAELPGIVALETEGFVAPPAAGWSNILYRSPSTDDSSLARHPTKLIAVPYFCWANRTPGRMQIWLRTTF